MIFRFIHVILLAAVKFILTLPYAMIIGMKFEEAVIAVLIGGIGGFLFFYYLSKHVLRGYNLFLPVIWARVPMKLRIRVQSIRAKRKIGKKVKIFTRRNRFLARFRKSYGLPGIILSTPVFLTIPLGAFLAHKYYSKTRYVVLYMILSIVGWTAVLSGFIHLFPKVFL